MDQPFTRPLHCGPITYWVLNLPGNAMDGYPVGNTTNMKQHLADLIASHIIESLNDEGDLEFQKEA